jgi:diguanylate cyclase (GGDEF)-like protein
MVAPLQIEGRMLGVVYLDSTVARGLFTNDDVGILTAIISHVAGALETARAAQLEKAMESANQQRELAETLRQTMVELTATLDRGEVLGRLLVTLTRVVGADAGWLICPDDDGSSATILSTVGRQDATGWDESRAVLGNRLRPLLSVREPLLAGAGDPLLIPPVPHPPAASGMVVPLTAREGRLAVALLLSPLAGAFGPTELDIATALSAQGTVAYDNASLFSRVQELATTDELTGIANRRQFFLLAERELLRSRRNDETLTAMMIDIDRFKQVNDHFGHPVGDEVIAAVAQRLQGLVRGHDVLGRYGGEEFAVVLGASGDQAAALAERLRRAVSDEPIATEAGPIAVTISIGVAPLSAATADLEGLLAQADERLYAAKQAGRDRVVADAPA